MTRADMLVALYDRAIQHLDRALEANDRAASFRATLQAQRVVLGIQEGLNLDAGEVPRQIDRLCTYVHGELVDGRPEALRRARAILATLKSAFESVRPAATEMERRGQIPPLEPLAHIDALM